MRHRVDADAGFREVVELWSATTADDLHRVLVLHPPVRRSPDADEPFALLRRLHETEPATTIVTAVLLLTDLRWRDGISHLVRHIEASDVLDADQLDLLARTFIAANDAVYWEVPDAWFGEGSVIIELDDDDEDTGGEPRAPDGRAVARRQIVPPLRRWAATREVTRAPDTWTALLARARELDARSAAAIAAGLLDGIDSLSPPVQGLLIHQAIRWPDQAVRRLGLGLFADREGPEAAKALAENDPNKRIRDWADSLVNPPPARRPAEDARAQSHRVPRSEEPEPPLTLF
ncbi:MAG: hypothetical protein ACHQNA_13120 [Acidimicrobiales bacterium]